MTATHDIADRFGRLSFTVLNPDHPINDFVPRMRIPESDPDGASIDVLPTQYKRVEIEVGDLLLSVGWEPAQRPPYQPPEPEEMPVAFRKLGMK